MTKSRRFLRNLVKCGLLLNFLITSCLFPLGCSSSTKPTFLQEKLADAISEICKKEYSLDVQTKLVGSTLWIYVPLEDIFVPADKNDKYTERFQIEKDTAVIQEGTIDISYQIKSVPESQQAREVKYSEDAQKKINDVWGVMRRVFFSSERFQKGGVEFFCIVIADIKTGIELREITYYLDLKKVSYGLLSVTEYQHRTVQETSFSPEIIGDKDGAHVQYKDISMQDFICAQIKRRIELKFQRPEVEKNADIDKEILKIAVHTLKIYNFDDFSELEITNLADGNKMTLNKAAALSKPTE